MLRLALASLALLSAATGATAEPISIAIAGAAGISLVAGSTAAAVAGFVVSAAVSTAISRGFKSLVRRRDRV